MPVLRPVAVANFPSNNRVVCRRAGLGYTMATRQSVRQCFNFVVAANFAPRYCVKEKCTPKHHATQLHSTKCTQAHSNQKATNNAAATTQQRPQLPRNQARGGGGRRNWEFGRWDRRRRDTHKSRVVRRVWLSAIHLTSSLNFKHQH